MTLSDIAEHCPGLRMYFIPKYGWGWKPPRDHPEITYESIELAGIFELEVQAVFKWADEFRGFSGTISDQNHLLDGYNFVIWSMSDGTVDLSHTNLAHRWDIFFSHQPFREDFIDFPDQDEAGVGYGFPSLKRRE